MRIKDYQKLGTSKLKTDKNYDFSKGIEESQQSKFAEGAARKLFHSEPKCVLFL